MEIEELPNEEPIYVEPKEEKPFIHGWKYLILAIGYFQMLNLIFWIVQILAHEKGDIFFGGYKFEKITYYFGWFSISLTILYFLGAVILGLTA